MSAIRAKIDALLGTIEYSSNSKSTWQLLNTILDDVAAQDMQITALRLYNEQLHHQNKQANKRIIELEKKNKELELKLSNEQDTVIFQGVDANGTIDTLKAEIIELKKKLSLANAMSAMQGKIASLALDLVKTDD